MTATSKTLNSSYQAITSQKLEKLAHIIGRNHNVQVVFQGTQAYTNGKRIVLPAMGEPSDELYRDLQGYLDHEAGHIRFTNFQAFQSICSPFKHELANVLEDFRIEREMVRHYPGCRYTLDPLNAKLGQKIREQWHHLPWSNQFLFALHQRLIGESLSDRPEIEKIVDYCQKAIDRINDAQCTENVIQISEEILTLINTYRQEQNTPKPSTQESPTEHQVSPDNTKDSKKNTQEKSQSSETDQPETDNMEKSTEVRDELPGSPTCAKSETSTEHPEDPSNLQDDQEPSLSENHSSDSENQTRKNNGGNQEQNIQSALEPCFSEEAGTTQSPATEEENKEPQFTAQELSAVEPGINFVDFNPDSEDSPYSEQQEENQTKFLFLEKLPSTSPHQSNIPLDPEIDFDPSSRISINRLIQSEIEEHLNSISQPQVAEVNSMSVDKRPFLVFTKAFDRVIDKTEVSPQDIADYQLLSQQLKPLVSQLKQRFGRILDAVPPRGWKPEQPVGLIDPRTITRIAHPQPSTQIFRQSRKMQFRKTSVSLLIDLSGSMRTEGRIKVAKETAIALVQTLKVLQIPTQVFGFTSKSIQEITESDSIFNNLPSTTLDRFGRVGRFIEMSIYLNRHKPPYSLMSLQPRGATPLNEAIEWTVRQINSIPEPRKILFVLTDGEPAGEKQALMNWDCLQQIRRAEHQGIEVIGIGIQCQEVENYFSQFVVVQELKELPTKVMDKLEALLKENMEVHRQLGRFAK